MLGFLDALYPRFMKTHPRNLLPHRPLRPVHSEILLALIVCFSVKSPANINQSYELAKPTDYRVQSYWDWSLGLGYLNTQYTSRGTTTWATSATETSVATFTDTYSFSGMGPYFDLRHGVSLDEAGLFEVGSRLGYYAGTTAKRDYKVYVQQVLQTLTTTPDAPAKRNHFTGEIYVGFGYVMTYLPVRWQVHFLYQTMQVGTSTDLTQGTSGLRGSVGYHLSPHKSVNFEYTTLTPTQNNLKYPMQFYGVSLAFHNPMSYPDEPWRKKYEKEKE